MTMKITSTAKKVLSERYYLKDEDCWNHVAYRVAKHFQTNQEEHAAFLKMLSEGNALPNSPVLMNAGTNIKAYSACYVLPVEDSIESIFKYYGDAGLISKSGGGVGANFSAIRSAGSTVHSTDGVASGPISFMKGQDALTDVIKQGGRRRGANMGILDCDHPDVLEFIKAKDEPGVLENFNLSVRVTDRFMEHVTCKYSDDFRSDLDPRGVLWNEITKRAWSSAEPGVLFGDTIEKGNLVPHLGKLNATNPCSEQPLLDYESCTLGSINLSQHVCGLGFPGEEEPIVDYDKLRETTRTMVLLLNRVLDKSIMPIPECQEAMEKTRKIGVGIMGLHDMLIQMGLPYDSEEGRALASEVMEFINIEANRKSAELATLDGAYSGFLSLTSPFLRNAHLTTIAPTGTLSMIADCSSGCEPYFSCITEKTVLDGTSFRMVNKWVEREAKDSGITIDDVIHFDSNNLGLFKSANDIHWKDHIKMVATLQKHVDSSISKTINMPEDATIKDVKEAYELAWRLGCKGISIYRNNSRHEQVLNVAGTSGSTDELADVETDTRMPDGRVHGLDNSHVGLTVEAFPVPYKLDLADELKSRRYRFRDVDGKKIYFNVCTQADQPVEVFAKTSEEVQGSYWNTICRLLSLAMRYNIPLDDICKQLRKSSSSVSDIPSKLARILDKYKVIDEDGDSMSLEDKVVDNHQELPKRGGNLKCPECGLECNPEGSCWACRHCGWSKCL